MVEKILQSVCIVKIVAKKMEDHAWIQSSRPRRHRDAVQGREAHAGIYAYAINHATEAGSAAEMGTDHPTGREIRVKLPERARDVFVRESMKAVAANAGFVQIFRNSETRG